MAEEKSEFVTEDRCNDRHGNTNRLVAALIVLSVFVLGAALTATGAAAIAAGNYQHVKTSLTEIKTDIREMRATQVELLRNGKQKQE